MIAGSDIEIFMDYVKKVYPDLQSNDLILQYEGEVNHEIIKAILKTLENYFKKLSIDRFVQKKIFNVVVECIQNIEKHTLSLAMNESKYAKRGGLIILEDNGYIDVVTGNVINKEQKLELTIKQSQIEGKDKKQLREDYKKQLIAGTISSKGGAGLGFIDIARKTNNQLKFYFFDLNNDLDYFILRVNINKNTL